MKKILLLMALLLTISIANVTAQTYQLQNAGFEEWTTETSDANSIVPTGFNSFYSASGTYANQAKAKHSESSTDVRPNATGNYSLRMFSTTILVFRANGNVTTGRMNAGAMTASANVNNYNYTDFTTDPPKYCPEFSGLPDSMRFWVKYLPGRTGATNTTDKGRIRVYIHGTGECRDAPVYPSGKTEKDYYYGKASKEFFKEDGGWHNYSVPFEYDGYNTVKNANGNYHILVSMTTNATPGGGANNADVVYFDDIEMIYLPRLCDLTVNSVTIPDFHRDTLIYHYPVSPGTITFPSVGGSECGGVEGTIDATTTVADQYNPFTEIEITNSHGARVYTVNFYEIETPTVANAAISRCGAATVNLSATPSDEDFVCRWYSAASGGTPLHEGDDYAPAVSATTTFYVSTYCEYADCESERVPVTVTINPIPATPVVETPIEYCGGGTITLSATPAENAVCRWYESVESATPLASNQVTVNESRSYFVSSYNSTTTCESSREELQITIHDFPTAPVVSNQTRCGEGEVIFTVTNAVPGTQYIWHNQDNTPIDTTDDSYSTIALSVNTHFSVMAYNPVTHCKSASQTITATINAIPATPVVTPIVNCGSDNFTLSATPAEDAVCRWYATAESTDPLATGSSYGTGLIGKDSSLFVSSYNVETGCESAARAELQITIHAIPELPVAVNDTVCGSENIILQGIYDAENATTCIWYENENGGIGIDTATTYSPAETTVLYISSYNENTGCESGRAPIYAVRYEMPETPVITTTHYCDAGNYTLTPMLGAHGETIRWYNENDELINTATSLLVDLESNREYVYNISTYNATTQCESSIVSFTVPVYGVSETVETKSECVAYVWRDRTLTESNIYKDTLRNKQGCDSLIFTLNLTILDPVSYSFSATACESYTWNGSTYTVSDNYTQTFTADNGCDSVVTLLLTINPVYAHTDSKTICENELPYTYGDTTFSIGTSTGEYPVTFQSVNGCDSVVTLSLTVNPVYAHTDSDIICENELPYTYGDTTFLAGTVSGEYLVKFSTVNGCDSMVTLSLTVNPSYHLSDSRTICASELPYTYGGHIFPTGTVTGEYPVTFQSINGCDSVITLSLTVFPTYKPDTAHVTICQGEVHDFFGKLLDVTGIYDTTILTVHGCDSVVVLNLTVGNQTIIPIQASICKGETYTFYDMVLDEAGIYTEILTAHSGCDTIVELNLRVNPVYNQIIDTAICEGSSFFFHNKFYSQAIDTTVHYESVHGCDSIVTLKLTINYPVSTTLDPVEACNAYTWNGSTYTVSDNYVQMFTADNGCDSIVTLPLTIYNSNKTVVDTAACEEVVWDNLVFTKDTIHLIVSQGDGVCTDTLILNVTVYQPVEHILEPVSLCLGETYAENGFAFVADEAGISEKSLSLTTTQGCDSIVKLTVTIHPVPETTHIHNTICQGDSVLFAGEWRKESNIYRDTLTTIHGCDSVISLNLTVNPSYSHTDSDVICENELPYTYGDTTFLAGTVTGEYLVAFGTVNGCDSIITLSLTVNPVYNHIDNKIICENELPYTYGNTTFPIGTGTGDYPVTFQSVNGCDSVVTLSLTINPTYNHEDSDIICENELPYTYGNTTFPIGTGTGDYPVTFQSVNGCDSVVTLSLTVNPAYSHADSRTICENELPYTYGDTTFLAGTVSGDYPVTFNSVNGCDSVVTLSLTVNPSYNHIDSKIICENELPYTYGDTTFLAGTVTDEYLVTFRTVNGCDSVITLSLTINPVYNVEIDSTICQGQSVLFGGEARTSTGLYRDTLPTIHGCDSVITLNLTVNMPSATTLYDTICQGEPYTDNGFNLAEQYTLGTREHVLSDLTNAAGCDSIVTLRLTVNRVWTRNVDLSVCDSYRWNDSTYTESTTVVHIYQTTSGCDSTVTLNLTVNHSSPTHYLTDTICVNEVYNEHGFNVVYDTEGIFTENRTLTNSTGCDSTLTVTLTVMPNYSYRITDTILAGQVYTEYGFNIVTERPNIYRDTLYLNSEFGCDSIITLALFATPGLGTVDYQQGFTFDVYPNPTRETVTIEASTLINEIEFFDVNGRRVLCLEAIATREERCNIAGFAPGIYFIRVQTEKGVLTKKLIVQ